MDNKFSNRGSEENHDKNEKNEKYAESIIKVNRVSKTVKGGRNFAFSVLATVGDKTGKVGVGMGKAKSVPNAIVKSINSAKKKQITVSLADHGRTIPHPVVAKSGASRISMFPAAPGTGVIAGGAARPILEALGIKDVMTKAQGSRNPVNLAKATMKALEALRTPAQIAKKRGLTVQEVFGLPPKAPKSS